MSFDVNTLKSASDDSVPSSLRTPENGTISAIRHNTLFEWGLIGKGASIVNNDSSANLEVRLHNPRNTPIIIPPSSELPINEWFAEIHCIPDGTTGNFQIIIETTTLEEARRNK